MASQAQGMRDCPYCKEPIRDDAVRCKHCLAAVAPLRPAHGGTCPFCKESIHPEAIRCPHCRADLVPGEARPLAAPGAPAALSLGGRPPTMPVRWSMRMMGMGEQNMPDREFCDDGTMHCLDHCIIYWDGRILCRYYACGSCL